MFRFRRAIGRIVALCCVWMSLFHPAAAASRPNVLFISIDDLNDWLGCLDGHPQAVTPNIDRLAARGVVFTNAHCLAPACRPSRAALFSGMVPQRTNVWSNRSAALLDQHPDARVLPRVFQQAGYSAVGCGKLIHQKSAGDVVFQDYFKPEQRWSPLTKSLAQYARDELPTKGSDHPRHVVQRLGHDPVVLPLNRMPSDRNRNKPAGESFDWGPFDVSDAEMGDTQITDWAIEQLQKHRDKPLFLGVGYYRPHIPLWAPARYFERFNNVDVQLPPVREDDLSDLSAVAKRWAVESMTAGSHATVARFGQWEEAVKSYLACVTFVDHQIGRLIRALDSGQFVDNTLIVLWSDHGWHLGEKQHWGKWTGWERSTRVPLVIVPPKNGKDAYAVAGSRCHQPVSLLDLFPTLTEACGVAAPDKLDGASLLPLLQNPQRATDRAAVTFFDEGNVTVRTNRWRYIQYADGTEELYDHESDPNEWENVANDRRFRTTLHDLRMRATTRSVIE